MGRKKLSLRRIENPNCRQVTFMKRKDGILKKANELAVLCDTDVAIIMFSPAGRLVPFASNGSVEDIFLRFVDRPDELRGGPINHADALSQRLKQLKHEDQMLEKIAIIEDLEGKLDKLNRRRCEALEKMKYYDPNVENIHSALEAGAYQQFLSSAIQSIHLLKAKLLGSQLVPAQTRENIEETRTHKMEDAVSRADDSIDEDENSEDLDDEYESGTSSSMEHNINDSKKQQWNDKQPSSEGSKIRGTTSFESFVDGSCTK